ncbi:hypothetical protein FOVG_07813 [Fusarium oxysporum f. sp. pisi HDV247]|uniref:Uncharacterized protein n=1 Tax=Fusarium oxysporum f. sp. pisi HDV247 TaxID=1080344 RepID=W9PK57_FUSOX|nr:hypothetical protein FOVG_07813 [Fusarium oxysporum f. sp. pisi HDV247]
MPKLKKKLELDTGFRSGDVAKLVPFCPTGDQGLFVTTDGPSHNATAMTMMSLLLSKILPRQSTHEAETVIEASKEQDME